MNLRSRTNDSLHQRLGDQEALLDNLSLREIRKITQFVELSESLDPLSALFLNAPSDLRDHTSTLVYFYTLSRHWPRKMRGFDNLIKGACRVIKSDFIEEFKTLDEITQRELWEKCFINSTQHNSLIKCADKAFIRLLIATGFPVTTRQLLIPEVAKEYIEKANRARYVRVSQHSKTSEVDYSLPTDEFMQKAQEYSDAYHAKPTIYIRPDNTLDPHRTQIILMLRALYGEENVVSMLERFSNGPVLLCPMDMIELLEDWENLRQYPNEWIEKILDLQHSR